MHVKVVSTPENTVSDSYVAVNDFATIYFQKPTNGEEGYWVVDVDTSMDDSPVKVYLNDRELT